MILLDDAVADSEGHRPDAGNPSWRLSANNTGFRWAIDRYDKEYLEVVATEPHYPENALGSGGEVSFVFRGKKVGTGEIVLKNWRHWEEDSSVTNRFRVRLRLEP